MNTKLNNWFIIPDYRDEDGIYCGFVYSNDDNGFFIHTLDPKYYKIRGKNECGQ